MSGPSLTSLNRSLSRDPCMVRGGGWCCGWGDPCMVMGCRAGFGLLNGQELGLRGSCKVIGGFQTSTPPP